MISVDKIKAHWIPSKYLRQARWKYAQRILSVEKKGNSCKTVMFRIINNIVLWTTNSGLVTESLELSNDKNSTMGRQNAGCQIFTMSTEVEYGMQWWKMFITKLELNLFNAEFVLWTCPPWYLEMSIVIFRGIKLFGWAVSSTKLGQTCLYIDEPEPHYLCCPVWRWTARHVWKHAVVCPRRSFPSLFFSNVFFLSYLEKIITKLLMNEISHVLPRTCSFNHRRLENGHCSEMKWRSGIKVRAETFWRQIWT